MSRVILRDTTDDPHTLGVTAGRILKSLKGTFPKLYWSVHAIDDFNGEREFDIVGKAAVKFEDLERNGLRVSTSDLVSLCRLEHQLIWAELRGHLGTEGEDWVIKIRAIDSTYFEVITFSDSAIRSLQRSFNNVETKD